MFVLTIWDTRSSNYGANPFVEARGTESTTIQTERDAMRVLGCVICDTQIVRAVLETPTGCLTWQRDEEEELEHCGNCDPDYGNCGYCG